CSLPGRARNEVSRNARFGKRSEPGAPFGAPRPPHNRCFAAPESLCPSCRNGSAPAPTRSNLRARPRLEALEDRRLMAAGVTYHLGAVIPNVKVETVYWGFDWYLGGQNNLSQQAQQYDNFFKVLTNSSYMDLLNQYGANRGQFLGDYKTDYQQ